jgi:hypothetical protein
MKKNYLCITITIIFPFLADPRMAHGQTLTFLGSDRQIQDDIKVQNGIPSEAQESIGPLLEDNLTTNSVFNHAYDNSFSIAFASANNHIQQNSTISSTSTNLTINGAINYSAGFSGSGSPDDFNVRGVTYGLSASYFYARFIIDQPFAFSLNLNGSASFDCNVGGAGGPGAYIQLTGGAVNYQIYPVENGGQISITNNSILPAGDYQLQGQVGDTEGFDVGSVGDFNYNASASISFALSVTPVQTVAPPVINSLTPSSPGVYQLVWTAPQAGNYRVLSSPDLLNWSESISTASYTAGSNTNLVNAVSPSTGYYRLEFFP